MRIPSFLVSCVLVGVFVGPTVDAAAQEGDDMESIGWALKAAVESGRMSSDEAMVVWKELAADAAEARTDTPAGKAAAAGKQADSAAAGWSPRMLAARPGDVETLLRPQLGPRDLAALRTRLDLDEAETAIIATLLEDYQQVFEIAASPLRESLREHRRQRRDRRLAAALERANLSGASDSVMTAMQELEAAREEKVNALEELPVEKREAIQAEFDAYHRNLAEAMAGMEGRLGRLRDEVTTRVRSETAGSEVTGADVMRHARALQQERQRIRREFEESIIAVAGAGPDSALRRTESELERLQVEREAPFGRLGGEAMNLRLASAEADLQPAELEAVDAVLIEGTPALAIAIDRRTTARIERELRGLELQTARNDAPDRDHDGAERAWERALVDELQSMISVRDEQLSALTRATTAVERIEPAAAKAYRDAAWRRGFVTEMKPQWCERATEHALRLPQLDESTAAAVQAVRDGVRAELDARRDEAVATRIRHEPEIMRRIIESTRDPASKEEAATRIEALERQQRMLDELSDRTEQTLSGVLTADQMSSLPSRARVRSKAGTRSK